LSSICCCSFNRLAQAVRRYGRPISVRTDNEAAFTSRTFRCALFVLGIRHQRTAPCCPWQNGRVERFFGTLKHSLDRLEVASGQALDTALGEFRFFYNHVRPHQNLASATPAEAWAGIDPLRDPVKHEFWFEAWEGLLRGYYLRRWDNAESRCRFNPGKAVRRCRVCPVPARTDERDSAPKTGNRPRRTGETGRNRSGSKTNVCQKPRFRALSLLRGHADRTT
jgi:hypothetical protein